MMALVPVSNVHVNDNFIRVSKRVEYAHSDSSGDSFYSQACRDGDLAKFNDLVDQADVNYVSESGKRKDNIPFPPIYPLFL